MPFATFTKTALSGRYGFAAAAVLRIKTEGVAKTTRSALRQAARSVV